MSRSAEWMASAAVTNGLADSIMQDHPKELFRQAILTSLPYLQPLVGQFSTHHQVWRKLDGSHWNGEFQPRPDIARVFAKTDDQIDESSSAFCNSFLTCYPEYAGMVGFRGSQSNWAKNPTHIIRSALGYLWAQHKTFDLTNSQLDAIVQEFASFVDFQTVRIRFQAQLLNFKMPTDLLAFPSGLAIRRLNEEEVSAFHGGPIETLGFIRPRTSGIHEFVVEGELDEPKILGSNSAKGDMLVERAKAVLDKAVLSLRTFKEGHVGYDYIHFRPVTFCPLGLFTHGAGDKYVPFGNYTLAVAECDPLMAHARLIFSCSEPAMEMACSRLADAETRSKPQDRLVDAVIGMEALLLAGLGKEDRKGELKFRFSLHYATLFSTPEERHRAFRVAKHLYDLRSMVAHGSTLRDGVFSVGDEKMRLPEAAKRASETLRHLVRHFLPSGMQAPYKRHEYWEQAYFGLPIE